jgi:hypothetical protein
MSSYAPYQEHDRRRAELDARTRWAWREYREALRGVAGVQYEEREPALWEQLQATLRELEHERANLELRSAAA